MKVSDTEFLSVHRRTLISKMMIHATSLRITDHGSWLLSNHAWPWFDNNPALELRGGIAETKRFCMPLFKVLHKRLRTMKENDERDQEAAE